MTIYSDTMFSSEPSIHHYTCAQVFTDGHGFTRFYPLTRKGDAYLGLLQLIHEVGVPTKILTDCALEEGWEGKGEWGKVIKEYRIHQTFTEPYSPWQNRAETEIGELEKAITRWRRKTNSPAKLWCYCGEWVARIRSLTAHNFDYLHGRVPEEHVSGDTPDISEFSLFTWYQWVWYRDPASFPEDKLKLGRWIGVASNVGQALTFWILTEKAQVIARSSIAPIFVRKPVTHAKL
jgi:hypothetical protein